ncbi:hypothetical protein [Bacillus sp. SM2101]|uniref:glycosyltransferase family 9 protein n=1 Tax=Bacillus sp. SM2101 TaxID=2805366 RepID=UPI001BDF3DD8|nr:hypothetical protein [Bacillus sp. SM2101]
MDLFLEKVKQNRKLLKNKGTQFMLLVEEQALFDAISSIEQYSKSIIIFKGDCTSQLKTVFKTLPSYVNNEDFKVNLKKIIEGQNPPSKSSQFPLEKPFTILIDNSPSIENFLVNDKLTNKIKNSNMFYPFSCFHTKEWIYPVYLPLQKDYKIVIKGPSHKKKAVLLDWFFGNGDVAIIYMQLKAFIKKEQVKDYKIDIITREKSKQLIKDIFPECEVYSHFDSFYTYEFITRSSYYNDVYFINTRLSHPPHLHLVDIAANALGFKEPVSPFISKVPAPSLPVEVHKKLNQINKESKLVGVQFKTEDYQRSWNSNNINKFVQLCNQNNIILINLTPIKKLSTEIIDFSYLPVSQLFELMGYLDAFVGIDSVCGHIAGVVGIPSITIWGKDTPLSGAQNPFVSYRVLSQNYSLFPKSKDISDVSAGIVFKRLEKILEEGFHSSERITVKQSKSGFNIEEIGL